MTQEMMKEKIEALNNGLRHEIYATICIDLFTPLCYNTPKVVIL